MIVINEFDHPRRLANHFIQFGISTWTQNEPRENQTNSIRRAVYSSQGRFSPHGSSEIPIEDMAMLFRECLRRDMITINDMNNILDEISNSIQRQTPE